MPSAILKRYHASIGKSVTSFMVGRREKARCLPALQNDAIGPSRHFAATQHVCRLRSEADLNRQGKIGIGRE